jgi:lipid A 3-O-deacylase
MFKYEFLKYKIFKFIPSIGVGVGVAMLDSIVVENRVKSTYFQFSDNIEFGLENKKYSVGIRFTHLSNLGIKKPNPSVDFYQLSLGYRF